MQSILTICNQLITQKGKVYNYQDILYINSIINCYTNLYRNYKKSINTNLNSLTIPSAD